MAHLLVLYDISDDRLRAKVADACLDYGLERVQYSAFIGELGQVHQRELEMKFRELVGRHAAHIRLVPLDLHTWKRQRVIEQMAGAESGRLRGGFEADNAGCGEADGEGTNADDGENGKEA